MVEMAERERLDQMTRQRARLQRAEHAREVERLLSLKRAAEEAAKVWHLSGRARRSESACVCAF